MQTASKNSRLLEVCNLSVMRGDNLLIEDLSFTLSSGDTIWVAGCNGIGKTSLLKCIAGLLRPANGKVIWTGQNVHKHISPDTGYQGHHDAHKPGLTVLENLKFWQAVFMSPIAPELALEKVGLSEQAGLLAKGLSAGQSRRLSLARLLIKQATLWILDEPAAAMDVKGQQLIHSLLAEHIAIGGCALIASHTAPQKIGSNTRVLTLEGTLNG